MPSKSHKNEINVLINSTIARIIAAVLTTIIHELGHFIVSILLGNSPILFHNRVVTPGENQSLLAQLLIPMGGPVISLIQGITCMLLHRKIKNGIGALLSLWMGISGLMVFFGYMMIAPLSSIGDTGKIFQLLEMPIFWQIFIAIISLFFFTYLLTRFHGEFELFIPEDIHNKKPLRVKWARLLILYPILISIVANTLLQLPVVHFLSLLPTLTMPFMLFLVYGMMIMSKKNIQKIQNRNITNRSLPLLIMLLLIIVINRVLIWGVSL